MGSDYSQIFAWDDPSERKSKGKMLCQTLDQILKGYHTQVDREGVIVEQPVKKRRGRRQTKDDGKKENVTGQNERQPEIKIGTTKQAAIKNLLNYVTPEAYQAMMYHVSFSGGERRSAFTESVLAWKHLWTTSAPPDNMVPSEPEEVARRSAAAMQRKMLPDRVTHLDSV